MTFQTRVIELQHQLVIQRTLRNQQLQLLFLLQHLQL